MYYVYNRVLPLRHKRSNYTAAKKMLLFRKYSALFRLQWLDFLQTPCDEPTVLQPLSPKDRLVTSLRSAI